MIGISLKFPERCTNNSYSYCPYCNMTYYISTVKEEEQTGLLSTAPAMERSDANLGYLIFTMQGSQQFSWPYNGRYKHCCVAYLNDLVIYGTSWEDHHNYIRQLLGNLWWSPNIQKYGWKCNIWTTTLSGVNSSLGWIKWHQKTPIQTQRSRWDPSLAS